MADAYNDLVDVVRDWSNRDTAVLPDSIIQSSLRYAADEAYRKLEIPPLEHTTYYVLGELGDTLTFVNNTNTVQAPNVALGIIDDTTEPNFRVNRSRLRVPGDTVSFIHIRAFGRAVRDDTMARRIMVDSAGTPVVSQDRDSGIVFNEKTDVRTYYDFFGEKTSYSFWTRHGNELLVAGDIQEDTVLELHYYRRLPALDARLALTVDEVNALGAYTGMAPDAMTDQVTVGSNTYEAISTAAYTALTTLEQRTYILLENVPVGNTLENFPYVRSTTLTNHWLRDQNERVLLFGALYHVFDYLQEDDQAQKYLARYTESISELNNEERNRRASGGNVQINYNGFGQI